MIKNVEIFIVNLKKTNLVKLSENFGVKNIEKSILSKPMNRRRIMKKGGFSGSPCANSCSISKD